MERDVRVRPCCDVMVVEVEELCDTRYGNDVGAAGVLEVSDAGE